MLRDGRVFRGEALGAPYEAWGEVIFNTAMSGYQESVTDPSYRGQIIVFTYPHIGNYGVNLEDVESEKPQVAGFVVREVSTIASSWRASGELHRYLAEQGIVGISEIDTRALTRHIRTRGALRGVISTRGEDAARLVDDKWQIAQTFEGNATVNAEPFETHALELGRLWLESGEQ